MEREGACLFLVLMRNQINPELRSSRILRSVFNQFHIDVSGQPVGLELQRSSRYLILEVGTYRLSQNAGTRCVIAHKNDVLIYFATEA